MFMSVLRRPSQLVVRSLVRYCSAEVGTTDYFNQVLNKRSVVVFMKGTPEAPRCGFSNAVVQIMNIHGVDYDSYNVLNDDKLRQGIKEFSNWPTIPQVYMNKEFVGGCDILLQMHQSGELIEALDKIGIVSNVVQQEIEEEFENKVEKERQESRKLREQREKEERNIKKNKTSQENNKSDDK